MKEKESRNRFVSFGSRQKTKWPPSFFFPFFFPSRNVSTASSDEAPINEIEKRSVFIAKKNIFSVKQFPSYLLLLLLLLLLLASVVVKNQQTNKQTNKNQTTTTTFRRPKPGEPILEHGATVPAWAVDSKESLAHQSPVKPSTTQ